MMLGLLCGILAVHFGSTLVQYTNTVIQLYSTLAFLVGGVDEPAEFVGRAVEGVNGEEQARVLAPAAAVLVHREHLRKGLKQYNRRVVATVVAAKWQSG